MSLITQQSAVTALPDLQENLDVDAVIEVFEEVSLKRNLISCSPPVLVSYHQTVGRNRLATLRSFFCQVGISA